MRSEAADVGALLQAQALRLLGSRRSARVAPDDIGMSKAKVRRPQLITRLFVAHSTRSCTPAPADTELVFIMLGMDGAGKTSLIDCLARVRREQGPQPTNGFNPNNKASIGSTPLTLFDVGGSPGIRGIWDAYYNGVHAAIFVVDSAEPSRFPEARQLLHEACAHECLVGKPLMVLANKQDLPNAVSAPELSEALRLHELKCPYHLASGSTNADLTEGSGLHAAATLLLQTVASERPSLQARIERQKEEAKEAERLRKEARRARLEAKREAAAREEAAQAEVARAEAAREEAGQMQGETGHP